MVRTLAHAAARAGFGDFSTRLATELVARAVVRPGDADVFAVLAQQRDPQWTERLDDEGAKELEALERAVRRAAIRNGEPGKRAGRKTTGARTAPDVTVDPDLHTLAPVLMSDPLDAMLRETHAGLDDAIAAAEIIPIEVVDGLDAAHPVPRKQSSPASSTESKRQT